MPWTARAHDVPPSAVLLDVGAHVVNAELQLPLSELGLALSQDFVSHPTEVIPQFDRTISAYLTEHIHAQANTNEAYAIRLNSMHIQHMQDKDWLIATLTMQAPQKATTAVFTLKYDVIINRVVNHNALVSVRHDFRNRTFDAQPKMLGLLGFKRTQLKVNLSGGSWLYGLTGMIALGMKHIAEGTDHLLFLVTLLLPAPLIARQTRWRARDTYKSSVIKILKTVSGFTLGHSLTLALGAWGWIEVPSRPIEVLIAISIAISAIHAWRPIFAGKEIYVAAGFGLVHGLAFANAISGFGYDPWTAFLSLLGFNLGIEAMQFAVIAVVLPWLVWASRSPSYTVVRGAGAMFSGVAAAAWIAERSFGLSNPIAPALDYLATHTLPLVAALALLAAIIGIANLRYARRSQAT